MIINLTDLAAKRAKMTFKSLIVDGRVLRDIDGCDVGDIEVGRDAIGIAATHNAAPVLIEFVRAGLAVYAADEAWEECPDDEHASACSEAYKAYDAALAKVSL